MAILEVLKMYTPCEPALLFTGVYHQETFMRIHKNVYGTIICDIEKLERKYNTAISWNIIQLLQR